jgi:hypothetical protein
MFTLLLLFNSRNFALYKMFEGCIKKVISGAEINRNVL